MKQKRSLNKILVFIIIVILLAGGGWYGYKQLNKPQTIPPPLTQQTTEKGVLRVGQTIDEDGLEANTKEFQPFVTYLASKLSAQGITKGEFVGVKSVSEMAQLVREGKLDIVIDSAFPVYVVSKLAGAQVIADRWKGGVGTYHSAIFVKQNSPIKTLDDLKGKMIAFDSTTSTVGYFLPKAKLIKLGYTLTQKNQPTDTCPTTEICYVFVHGNVYDSVAKGITAAGAESELEIDAYFGDKINNYRIISRSPDISRFLVAVRQNLDPNEIDTIKTTLMTMDSTEDGKSILNSFANTAKFTPIGDTDTAYGSIKDLSDLVEEEIIRQ